VVARVRGAIVERGPSYRVDASGATVVAPDAVVGVLLVVDDDATAIAVLDAIERGTPVRILSSGRR